MTGEAFNATDYLLDRLVASGSADRIALVTQAGELTYRDLLDLTCRAASMFRRLDVRREERVLMCLLDSPEFVAAFLGAIRIGAVPVPVSTMLTRSDLSALAADCRARLAVLSSEISGVAQALTTAGEIERVVVVGDENVDGTLCWNDVLGDASDRSIYMTWPDSPAFWLYTSGTTGLPKAATHRHADLRVTAETYARTVLEIGPGDRCYSVAKLFFAYGLGNALTFPFSVGASAVLDPEPPTPARVAENARTHSPTLFFAVPTFYAALLAADLPPDAFASVRLAVSAGEALPAGIYDRFLDRFGVEILDGIGSTEALHIFLSNHQGAVRPGTSGTVVEGYECRVLDDEGHPVVADEPGNLFVRGDSIASGYWCRTDVSKRTFQGEWLRTGDMYTCSSDGYYTYLGRSDDMLKSGGIWVSPFEVEATLVEHDDVLEAAVVGEADADGIIKPAAYVVASPGRTIDADELVQFCRSKLAAFKRPRRIAVVDQLPKTATGKVQRFKLRTDSPA